MIMVIVISEKKEIKQQKIDENKQAIQKLNIYLKKEADKSNDKINELRRFRMLYTTTESLDRLLKTTYLRKYTVLMYEWELDEIEKEYGA